MQSPAEHCAIGVQPHMSVVTDPVHASPAGHEPLHSPPLGGPPQPGIVVVVVVDGDTGAGAGAHSIFGALGVTERLPNWSFSWTAAKVVFGHLIL